MMLEELHLHGLIGGGGSNIKSVQRGSYEFTKNGPLSATITISAVNTNNSFVIVTAHSTGNYASDLPGNFEVAAEITNSTTITLYRGLQYGQVFVKWEVVEFDNLKSKQSGAKAMPKSASISTQTIASINISKSFLVCSAKSDHSYSNSYYLVSTSAIITSPTLLTFEQEPNPYFTRTIYWQVIEFN